MLIEWTEEYEICDEIDVQHKKLIAIINQFYDSYIFSSAKESTQKIIEELKNYANFHFKTEEELLKRNNYYLTTKHKTEHTDFENKINSFSERFKKNDLSLSNDIIIFLKEWINFHLLDTDKKATDKICK